MRLQRVDDVGRGYKSDVEIQLFRVIVLVLAAVEQQPSPAVIDAELRRIGGVHTLIAKLNKSVVPWAHNFEQRLQTLTLAALRVARSPARLTSVAWPSQVSGVSGDDNQTQEKTGHRGRALKRWGAGDTVSVHGNFSRPRASCCLLMVHRAS